LHHISLKSHYNDFLPKKKPLFRGFFLVLTLFR